MLSGFGVHLDVGSVVGEVVICDLALGDVKDPLDTFHEAGQSFLVALLAKYYLSPSSGFRHL